MKHFKGRTTVIRGAAPGFELIRLDVSKAAGAVD